MRGVILKIPRGALPSRRPVSVPLQNRIGSKPRPSVPPSLKDALVKRMRFCLAFIADEDDCLPDRRKKAWVSQRLVSALHEPSQDAILSSDELDIVDAVVDECWADVACKPPRKRT